VPHGVTTFFFLNLELAIEAFNGCQRIIHFALNGDPELVLLLAKLH
jgi:hypothetical protein